MRADPVVERLGKDLAGVIYRMAFLARLREVNEEYCDRTEVWYHKATDYFSKQGDFRQLVIRQKKGLKSYNWRSLYEHSQGLVGNRFCNPVVPNFWSIKCLY